MPSSITHQLIAEETLSRLPASLQTAVEAAPDEYFFGCQGPDFLFFYRIGNRSEYNLGKFMHRNCVYDVFCLFLRVLRGEFAEFSLRERTCVLSYALGYITHYCADSTFHPFVYRYLALINAEKSVHQQIENDWDVYFLRNLRGREAEKFFPSFSVKRLKKCDALPSLYARIAEALRRKKVRRGPFRAGIRNFGWYLRFFHNKCYQSQRKWEKAEQRLRLKKYFSRLYPRSCPSEDILASDRFRELSEGIAENADGLFSCAVERSILLCNHFAEALNNGTELCREEFSNGLLTGKPVSGFLN